MKLYFLYGSMNSAKSLNLLAKAHQFEDAGFKVMLLKPSEDTRSLGKISSRVGLEKECYLINEQDNLFKDLEYSKYDVIMVDEVQFLTKEQIQQLWKISRTGRRVFCYGLKTTFLNTLFDASLELMIMADKIEEIVSKCKYCSNKATTHLKLGGDMTKAKQVGDVEESGLSEIVYESVCQECYAKKMSNV